MFAELTPAVERALALACQLAHAQQAQRVSPTHLCQALLAEEEGRAMLLAMEAGLDAAALGAKLSGFTLPEEEGLTLPLESLAERCLREARSLAREFLGEATVSGEVLLLGLLRGDERTQQYLGEFGLNLEQLESRFEPVQAIPVDLEASLDLEDPTEKVDASRILDAAGNRAREGLRVVEDYSRFVLDDAFLTRALKGLRHDLAEALARVPADLLLEARETQADVGTRVSTEEEMRRHSLPGVAQANLKRLQEALRSLEEVAKLHSPDLGGALEQLRYRSYTLERAILLGTRARQRLDDARLYVLLSGETCAAALDWTIAEAAAGGVDMVQLREKTLSDRELWQRARQVRQWTQKAGVLFILNDRPDLARLVGADGVHLGQDDLPVKEARRILGPDAIIGVSTHDLEQLRQAILDGATYVGIGPTFPSGTKAFPELAGLSFVREALAETSLPAFVIGGVNTGTIHEVVQAGGKRVAVSQAIAQAEDPRGVAAQLRGVLEAGG
jgi:thiamine-phosphate pyrophosphorylase